MRTLRGLIAVAIVTAITAACSGGDTSSGGDSAAETAASALDLTGMWQLDQGSGPGGEVEIIPTARITMEVTADGEVRGSAACNTYLGTVVVDGSSVEFGPIATTRLACAPRPGAAEAAYVAALDDVKAGSRQGDELTLTGPDTELVFTLQG